MLQQRDHFGGALGVADDRARLRELLQSDHEVGVTWHTLEALGHRLVQQRPRPVEIAELGEAEREVRAVGPARRRLDPGSQVVELDLLPRLFDDVERVVVRPQHRVGVLVAHLCRLGVRLLREPSCRGKLTPVARERRAPGRHVPRERGQPRLGGALFIDPDLIGRRRDVAALEQVDDAPMPPVQLDLRVAAALAERDELVGGGETDTQTLRSPVHDVRRRQRHSERTRIGERAGSRDRLLDERPPPRLGGRIGERDGEPGEHPHPWRSLIRPEVLERLLEERDERLVDCDDRDAEPGGTEHRTREQVGAPLLAGEPRRLLERHPGAIGLARTQPRLAQRDEDLGQPWVSRPVAGKSPCALEKLDSVLPR